MAIPVQFEYLTGLRRSFLTNARLSGSWDGRGRYTTQWTTVPMQTFTAEDGCPAFRTTVRLDDSQVGQTFRWSVFVDTAQQPNVWGIVTEVNDRASQERYRTFVLREAGQTERYYLTDCRRLGANKLYLEGQLRPMIRFAVWAPNARNVELVRGEVASGYIWNDGRCITATIPMHRADDGVWSTEIADASGLADFAGFDHTPYMFRVTKDDGSIAYRTDLYSRCQIGWGRVDPEAEGASWSGGWKDLDGSRCCSLVRDPDYITELFREEIWPERRWVSEDQFWQDEFDLYRPLPTRIEDLMIYELDVEALGADRGIERGTLQDATNLLVYLRDLGVNALVTRMFGFEARVQWGYAFTPHLMMVEYAGSSRDQFKHFIRECHRNGIAVILDVDYSHFTSDADRKEWAYDSNAPEHNIYYWYEGWASDYPAPDGGYIENGSSGWAPRFSEEMVRKMFTSSAAALVSEFHVDGFRVNLTTAIYCDGVIRANGRRAENANIFGAKFLREWSRTLRLIKPNVILIAEDYSRWSAVTQSPDQGGLGFDAVPQADFHKHLIGSVHALGAGYAQLITVAGRGGNEPLAMVRFAEVLCATTQDQVIFHESHDEAANALGSARTISVAVNGAPLVGETRRYAEARCRFACGMTLLARGTPMLLMGAEIGSTHVYRPYTAGEDLWHGRMRSGGTLFRFYSDIIRFRLAYPAFRSSNIDVLYVNNADRVLAFRRWAFGDDYIVLASLNNTPFASGYHIHHDQLADAEWREIFNSDDCAYGGIDRSNPGVIKSAKGTLTVCIPANGFVVLQRQ
jgi:1,4-alpha-glucan branching enzyme